MDDSIKKYLEDIRISIDSIESYLGESRNYENYLKDKMLRRAVEREFEIIGEAMSRLVKLDAKIQITSIRRIISMRNRVIHGYDTIDDEIVWGTVVRHLPTLKTEILSILNTLE